jgi:hypothetical protein
LFFKLSVLFFSLLVCINIFFDDHFFGIVIVFAQSGIVLFKFGINVVQVSPDLLLVIIVFLAILGPELGAIPRNERSTYEPEIALAFFLQLPGGAHTVHICVDIEFE